MPIYIYGRYIGHSAETDPRRNWHALYAPCADHETVPDLVAMITSASRIADALECEYAEPNKPSTLDKNALASELRIQFGLIPSRGMHAKLLNEIVSDCEACRSATHSALVAYGRSLTKPKRHRGN